MAVKVKPKKGPISEAGRLAISKAQKKRWKKWHKEQKENSRAA